MFRESCCATDFFSITRIDYASDLLPGGIACQNTTGQEVTLK